MVVLLRSLSNLAVCIIGVILTLDTECIEVSKLAVCVKETHEVYTSLRFVFITRKKDLLEYRERVKNDPDSIVREGRDGAEGGIDTIDLESLKDEPDNIKDRIAYYIYKL